MTAGAVTIVIVNYNSGEKLTHCLEAVLQSGPLLREVFVVDNASLDGSESAAAHHLDPRVRLIRGTTNLGYAGAVNHVLSDIAGEFVAVLNMDTIPEAGWLEPLVAVASRPEIGAVNPLLLLADGIHVNAAGQTVHVTGLGFNRGLGEPARAYDVEPFGVSGVQGAAFLMRTSVLREIGGMDASGFLYHEDVNLSWMLSLAGYDLYCVPQSRVRHDYFLSMVAPKYFLLERNRWTLLLAYFPPLAIVALLPAIVVTELLGWGYAFLKGPRFLSAKLRAYPWSAAHRRTIASRRALARRIRRRSPWRVLARMSWRYQWRQFATLHAEKGATRREPPGGYSTRGEP
jgi:GT2 family glycosyltransferase